MGKAAASCFKMVACGGDDDVVKDDDVRVVEERPSAEKRKWGFRKKPGKSRNSPNTLNSETTSGVVSVKDCSESSENDPHKSTKLSHELKTNFEEMSDEKMTSQLSVAMDASPSIDHTRKTAYNIAESDAIVIQTSIRQFLAQRKAYKVRSVVKLQAVTRGHLVRRQAAGALRCVQAIVRMQALVRARLNHKGTEKIASQWASKAAGKRIESFDSKSNSNLSMERLLKNGFSQLLLESTPSTKPVYISCDPLRPNSGWKWIERWMVVASPNVSKQPENNYICHEQEGQSSKPSESELVTSSLVSLQPEFVSTSHEKVGETFKTSESKPVPSALMSQQPMSRKPEWISTPIVERGESSTPSESESVTVVPISQQPKVDSTYIGKGREDFKPSEPLTSVNISQHAELPHIRGGGSPESAELEPVIQVSREPELFSTNSGKGKKGLKPSEPVTSARISQQSELSRVKGGQNSEPVARMSRQPELACTDYEKGRESFNSSEAKSSARISQQSELHVKGGDKSQSAEPEPVVHESQQPELVSTDFDKGRESFSPSEPVSFACISQQSGNISTADLKREESSKPSESEVRTSPPVTQQPELVSSYQGKGRERSKPSELEPIMSTPIAQQPRFISSYPGKGKQSFKQSEPVTSARVNKQPEFMSTSHLKGGENSKSTQSEVVISTHVSRQLEVVSINQAKRGENSKPSVVEAVTSALVKPESQVEAVSINQDKRGENSEPSVVEAVTSTHVKPESQVVSSREKDSGNSKPTDSVTPAKESASSISDVVESQDLEPKGSSNTSFAAARLKFLKLSESTTPVSPSISRKSAVTANFDGSAAKLGFFRKSFKKDTVHAPNVPSVQNFSSESSVKNPTSSVVTPPDRSEAEQTLDATKLESSNELDKRFIATDMTKAESSGYSSTTGVQQNLESAETDKIHGNLVDTDSRKDAQLPIGSASEDMNDQLENAKDNHVNQLPESQGSTSSLVSVDAQNSNSESKFSTLQKPLLSSMKSPPKVENPPAENTRITVRTQLQISNETEELPPRNEPRAAQIPVDAKTEETENNFFARIQKFGLPGRKSFRKVEQRPAATVTDDVHDQPENPINLLRNTTTTPELHQKTSAYISLHAQKGTSESERSESELSAGKQEFELQGKMSLRKVEQRPVAINTDDVLVQLDDTIDMLENVLSPLASPMSIETSARIPLDANTCVIESEAPTSEQISEHPSETPPSAAYDSTAKRSMEVFSDNSKELEQKDPIEKEDPVSLSSSCKSESHLPPRRPKSKLSRKSFISTDSAHDSPGIISMEFMSDGYRGSERKNVLIGQGSEYHEAPTMISCNHLPSYMKPTVSTQAKSQSNTDVNEKNNSKKTPLSSSVQNRPEFSPFVRPSSLQSRPRFKGVKRIASS